MHAKHFLIACLLATCAASGFAQTQQEIAKAIAAFEPPQVEYVETPPLIDEPIDEATEQRIEGSWKDVTQDEVDAWLNSPNRKLRSLVAYELIKHPTFHAKSAKTLAKQLRVNNSVIRRRAANLLSKLGTTVEPVLDELIVAAFDSDNYLARDAIRSIGNLQERGAPAIPALTYLLSKEDRFGGRYAAEAAADALGEIGPKALPAAPALARQLYDEQVGTDAAVALAKLGCVDILLAKAKEKPNFALAHALSIVENASHDEILDTLIPQTQHSEWKVYWAAFGSLGRIRPTNQRIVDALIESVNGDDKTRREYALRALRNTQPKLPAASEFLVQAMRELPHESRGEAAHAFVTFPKDDPKVIRQLLEIAIRDDCYFQRWIGEGFKDFLVSTLPLLTDIIVDAETDDRIRAMAVFCACKGVHEIEFDNRRLKRVLTPAELRSINEFKSRLRDHCLRDDTPRLITAYAALRFREWETPLPNELELIEYGLTQRELMHLRGAAAQFLADARNSWTQNELRLLSRPLFEVAKDEHTDSSFRAVSAIGDLKLKEGLPAIIFVINHPQSNNPNYEANPFRQAVWAAAALKGDAEAAVPALRKAIQNCHREDIDVVADALLDIVPHTDINPSTIIAELKAILADKKRLQDASTYKLESAIRYIHLKKGEKSP